MRDCGKPSLTRIAKQRWPNSSVPKGLRDARPPAFCRPKARLPTPIGKPWKSMRCDATTFAASESQPARSNIGISGSHGRRITSAAARIRLPGEARTDSKSATSMAGVLSCAHGSVVRLAAATGGVLSPKSRPRPPGRGRGDNPGHQGAITRIGSRVREACRWHRERDPAATRFIRRLITRAEHSRAGLREPLPFEMGIKASPPCIKSSRQLSQSR
jgi:hypothetical protein